MVQILEFAQEVLEAIERLLLPRHLGRLYMTGNRKLIVFLESLRGRHVDISRAKSVSVSDMVINFLVGLASDVKAHENDIDVALMSQVSPMRIRRLHIETPHITNELTICDFSSLSTLEHFETSGNARLRQTLILPLSITSITLVNVATITPVLSIASLPLLSSLSLSFCAFRRGAGPQVCPSELLAATSQWSPSLTSFTTCIDKCGASFYGLLPDTIVNLSLHLQPGGDGRQVIDLAEVMDHLPKLASIRISRGDVRVSRRLPSTLKHLSVSNSLNVDRNKSWTQLVNDLPESLTSLSLGNTDLMDRNDSLLPDDVECAFRMLMPRLVGLEDLESAFRFMNNVVPESVTADFITFFLVLLGKFGLGAKYMASICASIDAIAPRTSYSLERVARLIIAGISNETILRAIGNRPIYDGFYMYHSGDEMEINKAETCLKLLAGGFIHKLNLLGSRVDSDLLRTAIRSDAARNLRRVKVSCSTLDRLDALLTHNVLENLKVIELVVDRRCLVKHFVLLIHRHRHGLGRLDRVYFEGAAGRNLYMEFTTDIRYKLNEMGIHFSRRRDGWSRFVRSPPAYLTNKEEIK
jgi:hypothetical protein